MDAVVCCPSQWVNTEKEKAPRDFARLEPGAPPGNPQLPVDLLPRQDIFPAGIFWEIGLAYHLPTTLQSNTALWRTRVSSDPSHSSSLCSMFEVLPTAFSIVTD